MNRKGVIPQALIIAVPILIALILIFGSSGSLSIFNPKSQYQSVDVDINKQVLQSGEDSVELTMDWTATITDRDYRGNEFLWISKDGKFYASRAWINLRDKMHQEKFTVSGLQPGWNEIEVKVGLHGYWDIGSCTRSGSIDCNGMSYKYSYLCLPSVELLNDMSCDLVTNLWGADGETHTNPDRIADYQADYSGQIKDISINTWIFKVYREKLIEIPSEPVVAPPTVSPPATQPVNEPQVIPVVECGNPISCFIQKLIADLRQHMIP